MPGTAIFVLTFTVATFLLRITACATEIIREECLPWEKIVNNGTECQCRTDLPQEMKCLNGDLYVEVDRCLTYENSTLYEGSCPYKKYQHLKELQLLKLPRNLSQINDFFCARLHREGLLCGLCIKDNGISLLTDNYRCSRCSEIWRNWIIYLFFPFVPITIFYLAIFLLQISIPYPLMKSFIFYSQGIAMILTYDELVVNYITMHSSGFMGTFLNVIMTLYEPWNLDFFKHVLREYCFSIHLKGIHANLMNYVPPFYIVMLIILTHFAFKLNNITCRSTTLQRLHRLVLASLNKIRSAWNPKSSVIDAIASFYFLCSTKLMFCSLLIFRYTNIKNISKSPPELVSRVVHIDSTLQFFGKQHIPYVILAIAVLGFLTMVLLLLTCYPFRFFRRTLNYFGPCTLLQYIHIFADKIQGHYKDGTMNTYDLRVFSVFYFVLQVLVILVPHILKVPRVTYLARGLLLIFSALLLLIARPYKRDHHNVHDAVLWAYFGLQCILINIFLWIVNSNNIIIGINILIVSLAIPQAAGILYVATTIVMGIARKYKGQQQQNQGQGVANNDVNSAADHPGCRENATERRPLIPRVQ